MGNENISKNEEKSIDEPKFLRRCCVSNCNNKSDRLYSFPKDTKQRTKWYKALGIERHRNGDKICHLHFQTSDYLPISQNLQRKQQQQLKRNITVPSLFLPEKNTDGMELVGSMETMKKEDNFQKTSESKD